MIIDFSQVRWAGKRDQHGAEPAAAASVAAAAHPQPGRDDSAPEQQEQHTSRVWDEEDTRRWQWRHEAAAAPAGTAAWPPDKRLRRWPCPLTALTALADTPTPSPSHRTRELNFLN